MDITGGIVEHIEEKFGKQASWVLLALIYLAIASACVGTIFPTLTKVFVHVESYAVSQFPGLISSNQGKKIGAIISAAITLATYLAAAILFIRIDRGLTSIGTKSKFIADKYQGMILKLSEHTDQLLRDIEIIKAENELLKQKLAQKKLN